MHTKFPGELELLAPWPGQSLATLQASLRNTGCREPEKPSRPACHCLYTLDLLLRHLPPSIRIRHPILTALPLSSANTPTSIPPTPNHPSHWPRRRACHYPLPTHLKDEAPTPALHSQASTIWSQYVCLSSHIFDHNCPYSQPMPIP